jgi:hypothetical protein
MPPESKNPSPKSPKKSLVEGPARPAVVPVDPTRLPASLAGRALWLCWRWARVKGRWTKPPLHAQTLARVDVTDPATLSPLEEALAAVRAGKADGVGVALEAAGLLGVDLDDCRDPATGEVAAWAAGVVARLDSYAEVSPSGTGVKVLVVAAKPAGRCRRGHVEVYDRGRYFTLTGMTLAKSHAEPQPRQAEVDAVFAEWVAEDDPAAPEPPGTPTPPQTGPRPDDDALLAKAFAARNGPAVRRLWDGDRTGYASESEADLALCWLLAFYFPDAARLDAQFRRSGLYREKWERADYRDRTLARALAGRTEFYTPPRPPGATGPGPRPAGPAEPAAEAVWDAPPLPLPTLPPVPAFPLEVVPKPVADYWRAAADSVHVPVDYVAVPGLALLGAAAGRSRTAAVKRTYAKPPLLWCVLIAPPSGGKSPALTLAAAPLWRAEARWRAAHARDVLLFDCAIERYKAAYREWQDAGCEGEPPPKPVRPTLRQAVLDDATAEAAVRVLAANPRGVVLAKDELSGLVLALNQYKGGRGADRQFWLSAWAGAAVKVNRSADKDAPPLFVAAPFAAVAGALCPEVLPTLRGDAAPGDAPADGFVDRFLMSYPDPLPAVGETWVEIPEAVEEAYCQIGLQLLGFDLVPPDEGFTLLQPLAVRFDDGAKRVWEQFTAALAAKLNARELDDPFRATLGKLREYGLRLAGLLWCLHRAAELAAGDGDEGGYGRPARIDAATMTAAAKLVDYFEAHARRCHGLGATDRTGRVARRLRDWLEAHPQVKAFTRSQAFQRLKDKRDVRNGEAINAPLNLLCDHGFLRLIAGDGGGRPGPVPQTYVVNPLWERAGTPTPAGNSGDFGDGFDGSGDPWEGP